MRYKVLTLTQPWATLVAIGAKRIETRSWATSYQGRLLIHAGAGLGPGGKTAYIERCTASKPIYAALNNAGLVPFEWDPDALLALPRGAIVAFCTLETCMPTTWITATGLTTIWPAGPVEYVLTDEERAFGDYRSGRYAWLLSNVRALPEPIPAKGALGLWTWEGALPDALPL